MSLLIRQAAGPFRRLTREPFAGEELLQSYIADNPEVLPLEEIESDLRMIPVGKEFPTHHGPIDVLMVDTSGNVYVVETKLCKSNDKRSVVAQVLDYGAALWDEYNGASDFIVSVDQWMLKKGRGCVRCYFSPRLPERRVSSADPDAALRDHEKTPGLTAVEDRQEVASNEGQCGPAGRTWRPEQNDAGVQVGRVGADIADALVHGQEHAGLAPDAIEANGVRSAGQLLPRDAVGLVPSCSEVVEELGWEVLVQLELHAGRSGRRLSSRASSAA